MQPYKPSKKIPSHQIIILIAALILFGSGYCFSQYKIGKTMKTTVTNSKTKNAASAYLEKNGSIIFHDPFQSVIDFIKE